MMRVFIIGQKWLGAEVFKAAHAAHDVAGVAAPGFADRLWRTSRRAGVSRRSWKALTAADIPLCDLIVCAHAHVYVTAEMRARAKHGAIGFHPSLLPRHRGRDAVRWAIHMGERVTGGTVYWLSDVADAGPIQCQEACHIRPDDSPTTLWRRSLAPMGFRLLTHAMAEIASGRFVREAQDDACATWEPSFTRRRMREGVG